MTRDETVQVVAFIAARCPSMRLEDATPEAWHVDLAAYPLADAIEAARVVTVRQAYCTLADLLAQLKALRAVRLSALDTPAPPVELTDDPPAYAAYLREQSARVADGLPPLPGAPELPGRSRREMLAKAGRRLFHGPREIGPGR